MDIKMFLRDKNTNTNTHMLFLQLLLSPFVLVQSRPLPIKAVFSFFVPWVVLHYINRETLALKYKFSKVLSIANLRYIKSK